MSTYTEIHKIFVLRKGYLYCFVLIFVSERVLLNMKVDTDAGFIVLLILLCLHMMTFLLKPALVLQQPKASCLM